MTLSRTDLIAFLIEAKLNTYAPADEASVPPLTSRRRAHRRGDLLCRDYELN